MIARSPVDRGQAAPGAVQRRQRGEETLRVRLPVDRAEQRQAHPRTGQRRIERVVVDTVQVLDRAVGDLAPRHGRDGQELVGGDLGDHLGLVGRALVQPARQLPHDAEFELVDGRAATPVAVMRGEDEPAIVREVLDLERPGSDRGDLPGGETRRGLEGARGDDLGAPSSWNSASAARAAATLASASTVNRSVTGR
ncbi:hypothetical protein MKK84_14135 [Methylobacterium sp. E-065]|nr:hypothetical protein [Methylobacterium sp. E-065]MCJ2018561.1 hypothetical protein [Methylobacterium sp. E-065]